ncbi:hypothetical protein ITP53_03525 [Nonomuraea sp. K274]|uniref:Uncharacterized protein n=1 Tax=Nonomuraea cypriaca TaxID=1187855 RepID=A0A931EZ61_9ACTN|nr:hypothetical protein [Nonomuraea cypriaca]MBF8184823.1 hypothetical protein [Nonomuraea cypriaca]
MVDDKVFVAANDRIVVTDTQGTIRDSLTGLPRPSGLAPAADGSRLYVAFSGSHQVAEIDTVSLEIIRRIDVAAYPCPTSPALSGSRLWIGYGCDYSSNNGLVGLDVSATVPEPYRFPITPYAAPLVVAAGNTLIIGEKGVSPADLLLYDVSGAVPTARGIIDGQTHGLGNLQDLAITTDGTEVISAFGAPRRLERWDTTTLARVRTYEGGPELPGGLAAVEVSPDGARVVAGWANISTSSEAKRIAVYDAATAEITYTNDTSIGELLPGTLAFSGNDIFGVVREKYTDQLHLWRMDGTTLPVSTLAVTAPSPVLTLEPFSLTGRLGLGESDAGAQRITVTRRLSDGTTKELPGVTTEADGTFTVTDSPPVPGQIKYDMTWGGNSEFRWSTASATTTVRKRGSSITVTAPQQQIQALEPVTVTGQLTLSDGSVPGAKSLVPIRYPVPYPGEGREVLPAVMTQADGTFTITDTPPFSGSVVYEVHWGGDEKFYTSMDSASVYVTKRDVSLTLSGPAAETLGRQVQFAGVLDGGGRLPAAGSPIKINRAVTDRDGTVTTTTLPSVPIADNGSFTFADTPPARGEYVYTVRWPGDWAFLPAETITQVLRRGGAVSAGVESVVLQRGMPIRAARPRSSRPTAAAALSWLMRTATVSWSRTLLRVS